jgi:Alcohol dehydrogenase GroES-like domain
MWRESCGDDGGARLRRDRGARPDTRPAVDQSCGLRCLRGSDIKAQPFAPPGMVMGHELGGEVVAAGSETDDWSEGVKVAVLPVISCGVCRYCVAGEVSHCAQVNYIGMGPAGGFAELAAVPARHAFAIPADPAVTYSALVEPFAAGLHGVHTAEITPGDEVLVIGAGGVGLTPSHGRWRRAVPVSPSRTPNPKGASWPVLWGLRMYWPPRLKLSPTVTTLPLSASDAPNLSKRVNRHYGHADASSSLARALSRHRLSR